VGVVLFQDLQRPAASSESCDRDCGQNLLRDTVKVKQGNLSDEIQQVRDSGKLSSSLHDSIDATRGTWLATHTMKSTQTGMMLDIEPGEGVML
jgi:hypothetical protein